MTRSFVPSGGKAPAKPPKMPVWITYGEPPRPPRRPRDLVIGKPWPDANEKQGGYGMIAAARRRRWTVN
jgi:hypothetical protein